MANETELADTAEAVAAVEKLQRLHPLSWLFVLVVQLRQFALPLIILLFTGRGDRYELFSLVGVLLLGIYSVFQYITYRYRVMDDELIVRSGVFQKSVRHIPFGKIQNVSITQNILQRLFNVAEVKLEAAGGSKPEAHMRVLGMRDARQLEELIRSHAAVIQITSDEKVSSANIPVSDNEILHQLSLPDVVKIGLINNRGMIVIGAAVGVMFQSAGDMMGKLMKSIFNMFFGWSGSLHLGTVAMVLGIIFLALFFLVLVRIFSVLLALLQYYGFSLSQLGRRLTVQSGLLSLVRSSLPLRRIQAYSLFEGWLHRRFARRSLKVDSAAGMAMNEENKSPLRDLVPLADPAKMDELIARFLASDQWPIRSWQNLHDDAWKREFLLPALLCTAITIAASIFYTYYAIVLLAAIPVLYLRAKVWSAHAAFACTEELIAVREGWISREWRFAEIGKLQGLSLREGILDRRFGMASLYLDTAGARPMASAFRIPYLPRAQADKLMAQLSAKISKSPLPF